jgi:hypothetical protein
MSPRLRVNEGEALIAAIQQLDDWVALETARLRGAIDHCYQQGSLAGDLIDGLPELQPQFGSAAGVA